MVTVSATPTAARPSTTHIPHELFPMTKSNRKHLKITIVLLCVFVAIQLVSSGNVFSVEIDEFGIPLEKSILQSDSFSTNTINTDLWSTAGSVEVVNDDDDYAIQLNTSGLLYSKCEYGPLERGEIHDVKMDITRKDQSGFGTFFTVIGGFMNEGTREGMMIAFTPIVNMTWSQGRWILSSDDGYYLLVRSFGKKLQIIDSFSECDVTSDGNGKPIPSAARPSITMTKKATPFSSSAPWAITPPTTSIPPAI